MSSYLFLLHVRHGTFILCLNRAVLNEACIIESYVTLKLYNTCHIIYCTMCACVLLIFLYIQCTQYYVSLIIIAVQVYIVYTGLKVYIYSF